MKALVVAYMKYEIKTATLCFTLIVIFALPAAGQKFTLTPRFGVNFPICYVQDKSNADPGFGVNTFKFYLDIALLLQYERSKINYFVGIENGAGGPSIRYATIANDRRRSKNAWAVSNLKFLMGAERYIATVKWFPWRKLNVALKKYQRAEDSDNRLYYLALFRVYFFGGISYNHLIGSTSLGRPTPSFFGPGHVDVYTFENQNSVIPFVGIKLQFFNLDKDWFQLVFTYHQGIVNMINNDHYFNLPSGKYSAKVGYRGTDFNIQLGYPISLSKRR